MKRREESILLAELIHTLKFLINEARLDLQKVLNLIYGFFTDAMNKNVLMVQLRLTKIHLIYHKLPV
jgi:hypothetical protein